MPILLSALGLIITGILAVYSVSIFESFKYTLNNIDKFGEPSNYFYFMSHLKSLVIALVVAFIVSRVKVDFIKKYRIEIFLGTLFLQLLVFTPFGQTIGGSRSWLDLKVISIQPVEFFKIGLILFFSHWLIKKGKEMESIAGFVKFGIVLLLFGLIFALLPDFGSFLVVTLTLLVIYWYNGGKGRYIVLSMGIFLFLTLTIGMQFEHVKKRINYFVNPSLDAENKGEGYQVQQGLIAIGAGGVFGKGYGKGLQKLGNIPVAQSDYIFAAFSEEIGLLGNLIILLLYFAIMYHTIKMLPGVHDQYLKLVALGFASSIVMQALVNIAVNVKLFPVTGLTLPFISNGGSSLLASLTMIVILYKILYRK